MRKIIIALAVLFPTLVFAGMQTDNMTVTNNLTVNGTLKANITTTYVNVSEMNVTNLTVTNATGDFGNFTDVIATNITIGANTLTTSEWAFLDGTDQSIKTNSNVTFVNLTVSDIVDYINTTEINNTYFPKNNTIGGNNLTNITWTKIDNIPANTTQDQATNTTSNVTFYNITASGTVGIGTTAPSTNFHVKATQAIDPIAIFERTGQTTDTHKNVVNFKAVKTSDMGDDFGSVIGFIIEDDAEVSNLLGFIGIVRDNNDDNTGSVVFRPTTDGTSNERMRIQYDGNVGIGTTAPSQKLEVNGNISAGNISVTNSIVGYWNATEILALENLTNYFNGTAILALENLTNYFNGTTLLALENLTNYFNGSTLLALENLTNYLNYTQLGAIENLTNYANWTQIDAIDNLTNYPNWTELIAVENFTNYYNKTAIIQVENDSVAVGTNPKLNFISGDNVVLALVNDTSNNMINITVNSDVSGGIGNVTGVGTSTAGNIPQYNDTAGIEIIDSGYPVTLFDALQDNDAILAYKICESDSITIFGFEDGVSDSFEDTSGIDATASLNESYNETLDCYEPTTTSSYSANIMNNTTMHRSAIDNYEVVNSADGNLATFWDVNLTVNVAWAIKDFGEGNEKTATNMSMYIYGDGSGRACKDYILAGSNDNSSYTSLQTGQVPTGTTHYWENQTFANTNAYRYYRWNITNVWRAGDNASAILEFELRETVLITNNMTLISTNTTAYADPQSSRLITLIEPVDAITINTDIKGYVSEDGGSNWDEVTLVNETNTNGTTFVYAGSKNITDQNDVTMARKITTHNNKNVRARSWTQFWKAE